jgi:hypothetical protein
VGLKLACHHGCLLRSRERARSRMQAGATLQGCCAASWRTGPPRSWLSTVTAARGPPPPRMSGVGGAR